MISWPARRLKYEACWLAVPVINRALAAAGACVTLGVIVQQEIARSVSRRAIPSVWNLPLTTTITSCAAGFLLTSLAGLRVKKLSKHRVTAIVVSVIGVKEREIRREVQQVVLESIFSHVDWNFPKRARKYS